MQQTWISNISGSVPQLKGARLFSFEELMKYTNCFSEANDIGSGGYGKVNFDYLSLLNRLFPWGVVNHVTLPMSSYCQKFQKILPNYNSIYLFASCKWWRS